jgi:hypothetical protein
MAGPRRGKARADQCHRCREYQSSFHNFVLLASTPPVLNYSGARNRYRQITSR